MAVVVINNASSLKGKLTRGMDCDGNAKRSFCLGILVGSEIGILTED